MASDRIERDIVIQAPVERVWATLTQSQHVAEWFAFAGAEVDLRPGGAVVMRWEKDGTFYARVKEVDPPRFFSYRWALSAGEQPRDGNSTLVEFTLREEGSATRLRVVESGLAGLDGSGETRARHVAENRAGWDGGLTALREYVLQVVG